jgi:hypothetical protein
LRPDDWQADKARAQAATAKGSVVSLDMCGGLYRASEQGLLVSD